MSMPDIKLCSFIYRYKFVRNQVYKQKLHTLMQITTQILVLLGKSGKLGRNIGHI